LHAGKVDMDSKITMKKGLVAKIFSEIREMNRGYSAGLEKLKAGKNEKLKTAVRCLTIIV